MPSLPTVTDAPDPLPTTRDVADWVRERIRSGRFAPGQRLIEADIIRDTGATRSRVREAIKRLEGEGLLVIEEFRGAMVRSFTRDELRQIYRARIALEGIAAFDCAEIADPAIIARLVALQAELDVSERDVDHGAFARANNAWHELIIAGARNAYIGEFLERLRIPIYRLLITSFYRIDRIDVANADHRVITAAIAEGRPEDAERAMRAHIGDGMAMVLKMEEEFRL